ncbi:MAG: 3-hydroxybutyrate dehydrogenase [Rhodobacteraceae bacterium]|nr:3-hydroxybutyrate dehydrogenase [Paracoccaceae bacterium]
MLAGKHALVTGSTSGIGLAIAKSLARQGADVTLNSYTNEASDHQLAAAIEAEFGSRVTYMQADLRDGGQARRLVDKSSGIDILVNNAGIQHVAAVDKMKPRHWDEILAVNLSAAFHTTASALSNMRAKQWGRIVNISSVHGFRASPFKSAYISAKHGIIGLTRTVALETATEPITCNAICPGYVRTAMVADQIPTQARIHNMDEESVVRDVMLNRQPSKQFVTVDQIGDLVVFLCSSSADQITGAVLPVDGGFSAM